MGIGRTIAAAAACVTGVFAALYGRRLQTCASIREIQRYDDGYGLYTMDVTYDYNLDRIIHADYEDSQGYVKAVLAEALPLVPMNIEVPSFGCSALQLETLEGTWLTGRNYDLKLDTSAMLVHCAPKGGYESLAFAALDNLGANDPTKSLAKRLACLAAPYVCLDGINEKGVTVSVLTLDSEPTVQRTGKPTLSTSLVMRLVLDRAASTDEAIALLRQYDMLALMGRDYHFFISDAAGKSVAVEYDLDTPDRTLTVTPTDVITNFYVMYGQDVLLRNERTRYGHGIDRYEMILDVLCRENGAYRRKTVWDALQKASQLPNPEDVTSNTQWSIVYDNSHRTAEITVRRHWDDRYLFRLK